MIPNSPIAWQPRKVMWEKPLVGWIKLNIDSSCKGNHGSFGGGDIIRDNRKNLLAADSKKLGNGTSNGAEVQALISGIRLCHDLNFVNVCIESDSTLVVGWMKGNRCTPWYLWRY